MLEALRLRNFKSAEDLLVPLGCLTVLAGLNGSGKSSVLQGIALVRQSLHAHPEGDRLILRGGLLDLGRSEDVHFEGAEDNGLFIGLKQRGCWHEFRAAASPQSDTLRSQFVGSVDALVEEFAGFQFIQADRLTPATQYLQASSSDKESGWLGCGGEFTVDFLERNRDQKVPPARLCPLDRPEVPSALFKQVAPTDSLIDQVSGWMQQLSPGVRLSPSSFDEADISSLRFEYTGTSIDSASRRHRPANVGFGLTYSLPIVVACLSAQSGSLLLLENPEAHLHPRGQAALGLLLAVCASDGVQIVVETHSDHLLNGIRIAVKHGRVAAENVASHFFRRDIESGVTNVSSPVLGENGRYDEWPEGFFDEWTRALDELLGD